MTALSGAVEAMRKTLAEEADNAGREVTRLLKQMNAPEQEKKDLHAAMSDFVARTSMAAMATVETDPVRLIARLKELAR